MLKEILVIQEIGNEYEFLGVGEDFETFATLYYQITSCRLFMRNFFSVMISNPVLYMAVYSVTLFKILRLFLIVREISLSHFWISRWCHCKKLLPDSWDC